MAERILRVVALRVVPGGDDHDGLRGFADVEFDDDLIVRNFRIITCDQGGVFCAIPRTRAFDPRAGRMITGPSSISLSSALKERIYRVIIAAWERHMSLRFDGRMGDGLRTGSGESQNSGGHRTWMKK